MAVSTSTIAYLLKKVYSARAVENAVYKDNPLMALMPKAGGFTGESHIHAVRYRDQLGRSPDFATALSGGQDSTKGTSKGVQFIVTRVKNYQLYTLETEAILAGRDDKGSLLRVLTTEVDSALNNIGRDTAKALFGSGFGEMGTVTAVSGSGPYTITVGDAITNFETGQTVVCAPTSVSTDLNGGTGVVITSVDRAAGTFTTATNPDTISTTNKFLFIKGDRAATSATAIKLAGLEAWNPVSAPAASESFFGIDRSVDATRLGGLRLDISAFNPEEGLITALTLCAREGANPGHFISSFTDVKNIHLALGSKVETEYMTVGDIGFSSIRINGPKGDVRVIADQNCPAGVGRLLSMDTWELKHLGDLFNMLDLDGATLSREYNADRFEGRVAMYGNLVCYAPGRNLRAVMPT
jgi:hypothetical protein